jgi:hypothetical protein
MASMTFRNYGGAYQLRIESADDLRLALDLPEALWVATSAPVAGLACDPVFLNYLDSDRDGRIRTDELQEAIRWTFRMLSGPERLAEETDWLRLGDVNVSHEDGARVQAVAERIVAEKADAVFLAGVTLAQVRERFRALEGAPNDGDGIVPPANAADPAVARTIRTITDAAGSAQDASGQPGVGEELARTRDVEKLILFQRWLIPFANNFIGFAHFYDPARQPMFGVGQLVMAGREIVLAMRVADRQAHKAAAEAASLHVLYVELTGRSQDPAERFEVACPVTAGEAAGFAIGKRGIFLTPDGRVWDARVADLIANPGSLWEAVRAPFDRIGEHVQRYGERWHKAQEAQLDAAAASRPGAVAPLEKRGPDGLVPVGLVLIGGVLAVSLSLATLGVAFAYVAKTLQGFTFWRAVAVILVLMALLVLPGALLAWLRLRRRNLAALLEASGWAINPRLRICRKLGRLLTHRPRLPEGSVCERHDVVGDFAGRFAAVSGAPLERSGALAKAVGRAVARAARPITRRLRGVPSDKARKAG